jgi:hypothetical protein
VTWQHQSSLPDGYDADPASPSCLSKNRTLGALAEPNASRKFNPGFLARVIRETCVRVQHNLETAVKFLPRPRQRGSLCWMRGSGQERRIALKLDCISDSQAGRDHAMNQGPALILGWILLLFFFLWLANRAALQAMDQPFPPRPALFLRLMLMVNPSRSKQLFSNLWVTHPILQPRSIFDGGFDLLRHAIGQR